MSAHLTFVQVELTRRSRVFNADFDGNMQPKGEYLTNADASCEGGSTPPCSDGSPCLDGDLGVYCLCYGRASNTSQEVRANEG